MFDSAIALSYTHSIQSARYGTKGKFRIALSSAWRVHLISVARVIHDVHDFHAIVT